MASQRGASGRSVVIWTLALLAAWSSGCETLETRSFDPSFERDGMWCREYGIPMGQARYATVAALTELKMPIYKEGPLHRGLFVDTKTTDDFETRVILTELGRHGPGTRISVRVGGFGTHHEVCTRLLDAVARHLNDPPIPVAPPPGATLMPGPLTAMPPGAPGPVLTPPPGATPLPGTQPQTADPALPPQPVPLGK